MKKMTLEDHKRAGAAIQNALHELMKVALLVSNGVPKIHPINQEFKRAKALLEKVRSKLEDRMGEEYPKESKAFSNPEFFSYYYVNSHLGAFDLNPYLNEANWSGSRR